MSGRIKRPSDLRGRVDRQLSQGQISGVKISLDAVPRTAFCELDHIMFVVHIECEVKGSEVVDSTHDRVERG